MKGSIRVVGPFCPVTRTLGEIMRHLFGYTPTEIYHFQGDDLAELLVEVSGFITDRILSGPFEYHLDQQYDTAEGEYSIFLFEMGMQ
jgi:hypothetical protein